MSWLRRHVGLDGVDLTIHFGVTMFLMIVGDAVTHSEIGVAVPGALSLVLLGVRRRRALKAQPTERTGEVTGQRLAELESRVADVDQLHYRVQELEERLDFAERLLAQARTEPVRLEAPR